ncbi:unnamed protein product [Angiostrongylus costaricensis]|uniref:Ovule protein n=1 Tax=Angiostrongylus costaricensis TaxID=334426 RepID=A0A0R3PYX5_ANGCS|nr:unnamed protein product [Angiostrongylus costaricensis]
MQEGDYQTGAFVQSCKSSITSFSVTCIKKAVLLSSLPCFLHKAISGIFPYQRSTFETWTYRRTSGRI